jgi:hypothetical protein
MMLPRLPETKRFLKFTPEAWRAVTGLPPAGCLRILLQWPRLFIGPTSTRLGAF